MRVLVTGGAGFIGSNFARYWSAKRPDDHLVVYDLLTYAGDRRNLADLGERIDFVHGDIGDAELAGATLRDHEIDTIVNFAAESHNSLAVLDPTLFFRTNVLGTQALLEAARHVGVERFHHVSTCEVYGDLPLDSDEVFTEDTPYRPRTPYNASKAGADHAVRAYSETYGLPITITNCSNNYGPYQFPEKVIPLFVTNALDDVPLPMYESTANKREWLHVLDHCTAIELVLEQGRIGETYNVGDSEVGQWLMSRPVAMSSNLHNVLFVPADGVLYVANASHNKPAAEMPYVKIDLKKMLDDISGKPSVAQAP